MYYGEYLLKSGLNDQALEILFKCESIIIEKYIDDFIKNSLILKLLGTALFMSEKYGESIKYFTKALSYLKNNYKKSNSDQENVEGIISIIIVF